MMDKAVSIVTFVVLAFLLRYTWRAFRAPTLEDVLDNIGAPKALAEHTDYFKTKEVVKVADGVYVALNYAIANSIMLVGPSGVVIVDTTESLDAATEIATEFKNITNKEVKAIVYTHHHSDHVMGTAAFVEDVENPPPIWAHHLFKQQELVTFKKSSALLHRAHYQFGVQVPKGHLNCGIGGKLRFQMSKQLPPTKFVQNDMDVEIAGIKMRFIHIPGETSDQMGVWLPDSRILLVADDLYKAFPNLYAIRGTAPRDINDWIVSLDKMRKLHPKCIIGSHAKPTCGEKEVYELISDYMYGVQHVHDQTVRFINKGMHPDEIAKQIKLPAELDQHPYLGQFYGTVPWSVKGVYVSYLGWFSGYAEELNPLAPSERAERMVALVGMKGLLRAARQALGKDDDQWALELASHVHNQDKTNAAALAIRQEAMAKLAAQQISANGRNFYMTAMMDDAGMMKKPDIKERALYAPVDVIMINMRLRLKAEEVPDSEHLTGCFHFTDTKRTFCAVIHKGIMEMNEQDQDNFDFKLKCTETVLKEIVSENRSPLVSYFTGIISIEGSILKLRRFMNYLDR